MKELHHGGERYVGFDRQWKKATERLYGRVLDYGCSNTQEPGLIADLSSVEDVVAYDVNFNPMWVLNTCERFNVSATLCLDELDDESFDCAFSWNVTEHFENPQAEFRNIYSKLKPGGIWSGRHHPFFSLIDGHHLLMPWHKEKFDSFVAMAPAHPYPHHTIPLSLIANFRKELRGMSINMMTLYQLQAYAVLAGFEIEGWEEIKTHLEVPLNPAISHYDAQIVMVQFLFRKPERSL